MAMSPAHDVGDGVAQAVPSASFALISGSAGWGITFPDDLREPGVRTLQHTMAFDTPWGRSDGWQLIELDASETADGKPRLALNVFSHGWPLDRVDHAAHQKAFWVLREAGVRKVLSDSTCGSLNRAVQPRDFIIVSDVLDLTQTPYSTLPGRFRWMCRGAQLICPSLATTLESQARELWPRDARVYGYRNGLVTGFTFGPRFETPAEARALSLLGADIANQSIAPEATNAREIGACFASATYVVNYVDGVIAGEWGDLDHIHEELGDPAVRISLRAIARAPLDEACGCAALRAERPAKYREAASLA
ncbi:MAG TPA: 5'-methylthioadenosine phosphorylase [Chloroflexota bacterium]|nr:5'-methylthioadenosine phosphorylase [Chloroflexota bacterium]